MGAFFVERKVALGVSSDVCGNFQAAKRLSVYEVLGKRGLVDVVECVGFGSRIDFLERRQAFRRLFPGVATGAHGKPGGVDLQHLWEVGGAMMRVADWQFLPTEELETVTLLTHVTIHHHEAMRLVKAGRFWMSDGRTKPVLFIEPHDYPVGMDAGKVPFIWRQTMATLRKADASYQAQRDGRKGMVGVMIDSVHLVNASGIKFPNELERARYAIWITNKCLQDLDHFAQCANNKLLVGFHVTIGQNMAGRFLGNHDSLGLASWRSSERREYGRLIHDPNVVVIIMENQPPFYYQLAVQTNKQERENFDNTVAMFRYVIESGIYSR